MLNVLNQKEKKFHRIMDNLKMDTPKEYFDIVTARHTITDKSGIYNTLKENGKLTPMSYKGNVEIFKKLKILEKIFR